MADEERRESARLMSYTLPRSIATISLWQPWASFIAAGFKPYETRHWPAPSRFLGQRIAIHAAKRKPVRDDVQWWHDLAGSDIPLPLGAIVCTAVLRAVLPAETVEEDMFGDYGVGRFAWYLVDVQPLEVPVPTKGFQGFWIWTASNA